MPWIPFQSLVLQFLLLLIRFASAKTANINVDASKSLGNISPINRFFGADEPNYAYYPDGKKTLNTIGNLGPSQAFFRTHHLLTTGPGYPALKFGSTNAYTEDSAGNPIYNWTIVDRIFDTYLENNVKPYVQIGFMPEALSTHPYPYFFNFTPTSAYDTIYTGYTNPPTSWTKWADLVFAWVQHSITRYGIREVDSWYWEVWNEPNIQYWNGTQAQFYQLNDFALDAVRRALPTARVGGPEVAGGSGGKFLGNFLNHTSNGKNYATGKIGTPLDFISFHAKGSPHYINTSSTAGHVQMGISSGLQNADDAFTVIAGFPMYKSTPIVIGEFDPDGCAACQTPQVGYRNDIQFSSYSAAAFVRVIDLAVKRGVNLMGALTWAFEFDDTPYFDGFRVITTHAIDKPIMNFHKMMARMAGSRLQANSDSQIPLNDVVKNGVRGDTDIGVFATSNSTGVSVLVWHYHDDDLPKPDAAVKLTIQGLNGSGWDSSSHRMTHYRVDKTTSNSYQAWLKLGSPQNPSTQVYNQLREAGQLQTVEQPRNISISSGTVEVDFSLPIQGLSLIFVEK